MLQASQQRKESVATPDVVVDRPVSISTADSAMMLAKLIYDVYRNPEENGIIIDGQKETNEHEHIKLD